MYTGSILRANETHSEERINRARHNLRLEGQDLICVAENGHISRLETIIGVSRELEQDFATIEEAMEALIYSLNNPEPETDYEAYHAVMTAEIGGNE